MPLTLTALNTEAAVSQSLALVGSDMRSQRWINTSNDNPRQIIETMTRMTGRRGSLGIPARQFNLKLASSKPFTGQVGGTDRQMMEEVILNINMIIPETLTQHTVAQVHDLWAYLRQIGVPGNVSKFIRGEP